MSKPAAAKTSYKSKYVYLSLFVLNVVVAIYSVIDAQVDRWYLLTLINVLSAFFCFVGLINIWYIENRDKQFKEAYR